MADTKPERTAHVSRREARSVPRVAKTPEPKTRPSPAMEETRAAMTKAREVPEPPEPVKTIRPKDLRELQSPTGAPTSEELQDAEDAALRSKKRARQQALRG